MGQHKLGILDDFWKNGGCQASLQGLLSNASEEFVLADLPANKFDTKQDAYFVNNFRSFTREQLEYVAKKPHMVWWHDALPVPYPDLVLALHDSAIMNFFMSPLHQETIYSKYGISQDANPYFDDLPAILDVKEFEFRSNHETDEICWIGSIYPHKGIEEVLIWARQNGKTIDFYGDGEPLLVQQLKYSNYAVYQGVLEEKELPCVLQHYGQFIHLPREIEACGRTAIAAYLSGCKMLINERVGFFSYEWGGESEEAHREMARQYLTDAPERFWGYAKECLL